MLLLVFVLLLMLPLVFVLLLVLLLVYEYEYGCGYDDMTRVYVRMVGLFYVCVMLYGDCYDMLLYEDEDEADELLPVLLDDDDVYDVVVYVTG